MDRVFSPALSVIIITPDSYGTIRKTIQCLAAQTIKDRLEIVIVAPANRAIQPDDSVVRAFLRLKVVTIESIESLGQANAAGIRAAQAPVVALVEEHVYPDPGWAEALLKAHEQSWAAVGPVVRNADQNQLRSWADFLITYGQWMEPAQPGVVRLLPAHNSSYKREILLEYGTSLDPMLDTEAMLQLDLQAKGYQLYLEPEGIIYHLGFRHLIPSVLVQFHIGRLFATDRAKRWSFLKRFLYIVGSPLIPAVRFFRLSRKLLRARRLQPIPFTALIIALPGLFVGALGEFAGYVWGPGDSVERALTFEFHRAQQ